MAGVVGGGGRAGALEAPSGVLTSPVHTVRLVQTLIYIDTLQEVAVVVEALLAVTLVAGLCVDALPFLADLLPKQGTFIDVAMRWDAVVEDRVVQNEAFAVGAEHVEFDRIENRARVNFAVVPPTCAKRAAALLAGDVGGEDAVAEDGVVKVQVALLLVVGQLLTALPVLGRSEALVTHTHKRAVGVLAHPVRLAQVKVLGTLVDILAFSATFQLVARPAHALVGAQSVHTFTSNTGGGEVTLVHIFTAWPVLHRLETHRALALERSQRVHTHPVGTERPVLALVDVRAAAEIRRRHKSQPTGTAKGTGDILTPPVFADSILGTLVHIITDAILASEAWLARDAFVAAGPVFTPSFGTDPWFEALIRIFTEGLVGSFQLVAQVTLALVVPGEVDTGAAIPTDVGLGAFIDIYAGPHALYDLQLVAPDAMTVVGPSGIHADPLPTRVRLALVHVYTVLVLGVPAVALVTVAVVAQRPRNAFPMSAEVPAHFTVVHLCGLGGEHTMGAHVILFWLNLHYRWRRGSDHHSRTRMPKGRGVDKKGVHRLLLWGRHVGRQHRWSCGFWLLGVAPGGQLRGHFHALMHLLLLLEVRADVRVDLECEFALSLYGEGLVGGQDVVAFSCRADLPEGSGPVSWTPFAAGTPGFAHTTAASLTGEFGG